VKLLSRLPPTRFVAGEFWAPVVGWEPWYEVSSLGRVRTWWKRTRWGATRLKSPRLLPQVAGAGDYARVHLCEGGRKCIGLVHRLVLEAFVGPANGRQTAHADGDKQNNALPNLRWSTQRENEADKILHGRTTRGERNPVAKATPDQVRMIRVRVAPYLGPVRGRKRARRGIYQQIGTEVGLPPSTIGHIARGERWAHLP